MTTCSATPTPWVRTHTVAPSSEWPSWTWGTEYWPDSNVTIGVLIGTTRVVPNATVCGTVGKVCGKPTGKGWSRSWRSNLAHASAGAGSDRDGRTTMSTYPLTLDRRSSPCANAGEHPTGLWPAGGR